MAARFGDRVYRSKATLPRAPPDRHQPECPDAAGSGKARRLVRPDGGRRVARGWIAIGDDARGILLAIGSTARGLVAWAAAPSAS